MKLSQTKRRSHKINSKALIISGAAILLLTALAFTYVYAFNGNLFGWKSPDTIPTTSSDQGITEGQVPSNSEPSGSTLPPKDNDDPGDGSSVETPTTPPEKPTYQRAGGDSTITVVASFQQASAGYCELQLSKSGYETLSYKSEIVVGTAYYSCSFRIARSTLPASTPWNAVIIHHVGDAKTSSDIWKVS